MWNKNDRFEEQDERRLDAKSLIGEEISDQDYKITVEEFISASNKKVKIKNKFMIALIASISISVFTIGCSNNNRIKFEDKNDKELNSYEVDEKEDDKNKEKNDDKEKEMFGEEATPALKFE